MIKKLVVASVMVFGMVSNAEAKFKNLPFFGAKSETTELVASKEVEEKTSMVRKPLRAFAATLSAITVSSIGMSFLAPQPVQAQSRNSFSICNASPIDYATFYVDGISGEKRLNPGEYKKIH